MTTFCDRTPFENTTVARGESLTVDPSSYLLRYKVKFMSIFVNTTNNGIRYCNQAMGIKEVIIYKKIKNQQLNYIYTSLVQFLDIFEITQKEIEIRISYKKIKQTKHAPRPARIFPQVSYQSLQTRGSSALNRNFKSFLI